jgi:hypothetical protein
MSRPSSSRPVADPSLAPRVDASLIDAYEQRSSALLHGGSGGSSRPASGVGTSRASSRQADEDFGSSPDLAAREAELR